MQVTLWNSESGGGGSSSSLGRHSNSGRGAPPPCPYGPYCRETNSKHFLEFSHFSGGQAEKPPVKKALPALQNRSNHQDAGFTSSDLPLRSSGPPGHQEYGEPGEYGGRPEPASRGSRRVRHPGLDNLVRGQAIGHRSASSVHICSAVPHVLSHCLDMRIRAAVKNRHHTTVLPWSPLRMRISGQVAGGAQESRRPNM
jgi:hypothetical protein